MTSSSLTHFTCSRPSISGMKPDLPKEAPSSSLRHPCRRNISMLTSRLCPQAASFKRSSSRFASVRSGSAGATARPSGDSSASSWARQHETWILLELCNAGSLQVHVSRV